MAPDVLVLASGGTLGEAWMSGLLAGIEDAAGQDFRATESFVGTSAGSLVAAALVAGQRPRRPRVARRQRARWTPASAGADVAADGVSQLAVAVAADPALGAAGRRARGGAARGRRRDAAGADGARDRVDRQHRDARRAARPRARAPTAR